jgi:hypothetical protein
MNTSVACSLRALVQKSSGKFAAHLVIKSCDLVLVSIYLLGSWSSQMKQFWAIFRHKRSITPLNTPLQLANEPRYLCIPNPS